MQKFLWLTIAMLSTALMWSCEDKDVATVNKPTVGIQEVDFNKETMVLQALVIPSSDTEALYWKIEGVGESVEYTKSAGGSVATASRKVEFGVEYTISAYAENKAGKSEVATVKYCPMPDSAAIAIGDVTLNRETMQAECVVYPSATTVKWYWRVDDPTSDTLDETWYEVEGNKEQRLAIDYILGETLELYAYAENAAGKSEVATKSIYFEEDATLDVISITLNQETMEVECVVAPSANTVKWYWRAYNTADKEPESWNEVEGNERKEILFDYEWKQNFKFELYAENSSVTSDVISKDIFFEPDAEITIGELTLNEETMQVECVIYPSDGAIKWYWKAYDTAGEKPESWNEVEGNKEQKVSFDYVWGKRYSVCAYAENSTGRSKEVSAEAYFEPEIATITVSEPRFDEQSMTVSFDVTPSPTTVEWYWGPESDTTDAYTTIEGNTPQTVSYNVVFDTTYKFVFGAKNAVGNGEQSVVEFRANSPLVSIAIENLTAYTVDAVVTKSSGCARYAVGAVLSSAFDATTFIEQAKSSLDPSPSYPFMVFDTATESRTFTEQDLVRNSRADSKEYAGIVLLQETAYTIAAYAEDSQGNGNIYTSEIVIPKATINGNTYVSIAMGDITETSASMTVTSERDAKIIMGYMDMVSTDPDYPFSFAGKSDAEIKEYIIAMAKAVPTIYSSPITRRLSNTLAIDTEYMAYAIAIKDGKVGNVAYEKFSTKAPSHTGTAAITAATIAEQTSHSSLTVTLTADNTTKKVRLYAAPETDHAEYKDNMEYVMSAEGHQNYREEYVYNGTPLDITVDIYHPDTNYYLYAVAVDAEGRVGDVVNVARLAGLSTDYYKTIKEVEKHDIVGTACPGGFDMVVETISEDSENISVTIMLTNQTDNIERVWLCRLNECLIDDVVSKINENFEDYPEYKMVKGSKKIAQFDTVYRYEDTGLDTFDPKYESLIKYDGKFGGTIIVAVALDSDGGLNICNYYVAGRDVMDFK